MKLPSFLAGALMLLGALGAQAQTTTVVPAAAIHLCLNVHDQDEPHAVSEMKALGFTCYRKDSTGAPIETELARAGITADFIASDGPGPTGQMSHIAALSRAFPGSVGFIESRNEVNNHQTVYGGFTDTVGFDQSQRHAILSYDAALEATANAMTPGIPVISHTDIHATPSSNDYANAHAYDPANGYGLPSYWIGHSINEMNLAMPGKPQAVTEYGTTNAATAPIILPQTVAQLILSGVMHSWIYELRDLPNDPYGLFNADWTPKPAVPVMTALNAVLADPGGNVPIQPLGVKISDPAINSVLIPKTDGSYIQILWRPWPDGKVHPFTWSYSRAMRVRAVMYPHTGGNLIWSNFAWRKAANQPSDWNTYVDGPLVLELKP